VKKQRKLFWSNMMRSVRGWLSHPWYPLVFGAYPVLALLAFNVGQIKLEAGWRALLVSILFSVLLFLVWRLILRDMHRAAFLSMLWMLLFFSYGHIHISLVNQWEGINFTPWMLIGWLILAVLAVVWATRPKLTFVNSVPPLNVIALGLAIVTVVQISSGVQKRDGHRLGSDNAPVQDLTLPADPPDIYYFILDMYTRADLMKSAYDYDNSAFVKELEARDFYVASCSQSNYTRTELSIASSLNMSYLQGLDAKFVPDNLGRLRLWDSLKHSAARYNLEQMGYTTISYANGFAWSELDDANVFLTPPPFSSGMTEFETLFLQTTLLGEAQKLGWFNADQIMAQNFRDRDLLVFNSMDDVVNMPGPKFVYVHLIMPHPPFVFGPNGEYTDPAQFWDENKKYPPKKLEAGYENQVTFLNQKMLTLLDTILSGSDTPPIIILQGDHGPWSQPNPQHFYILNAYHLPDHNDELYPTISPVNSFRLVFDDYFGGRYDMLKDVSYYSPVPELYDFRTISYLCQ
jgi:hypothetical protein